MESFKVSQCSISGGNATATTSSYNTQTCSGSSTFDGPFEGPTACHIDPDNAGIYLKYFCAASQLAQTMLVLLSAVVLVASF